MTLTAYALVTTVIAICAVGFVAYLLKLAEEDTRTIRDLKTTVATLRKGLRDPHLAPVYNLHETTPIAQAAHDAVVLRKVAQRERLDEVAETYTWPGDAS